MEPEAIEGVWFMYVSLDGNLAFWSLILSAGIQNICRIFQKLKILTSPFPKATETVCPLIRPVPLERPATACPSGQILLFFNVRLWLCGFCPNRPLALSFYQNTLSVWLKSVFPELQFLRPPPQINVRICSFLWVLFWGWGSHRSFIIRTLPLFWESRETTGGMKKVSLATMLLNTGGGDKGWGRETRQLALELM